ncbi:MAG: hypothetical protein H0V61_05675, partial [Chitinophagales bacterium]|nr:hypothetical protein [Chitinophagales bacterium]
MQIIEVTTPALEKEFIWVNVNLYAADPNYIRPLDNDILEVFDAKKNKLFNSGKAKRWLLKDSSGKYIGRIAAFFNS